MLDMHYPHLVLLPGLVNDSRLWQHLADEVMVSLITDMAMNLGSKTFIRQQQAIMERVDSIPSLHQLSAQH